MKTFCFHFLFLFSIHIIFVPVYGENKVAIINYGKEKCISSNGIPNHKIGNFPTRGNPHKFKPQNIKFCFSLFPQRLPNVSYKARVSGVTLTGIPIRPSTADWFDPNSRRGHSKNPSSGWNLEAISPNKKIFGLDANNAHVDKRGLYHYHGVSKNLLTKGSSLIGYAADGFEIHYKKNLETSYRIKNGERSTPPFGKHDGSYKEDYEYVKGSGDLDECNGGILRGKYVYFATGNFPFFPRCHWGRVSPDFLKP